MTDTTNCGACGNNCGSNSVCNLGACACSQTYANCNGMWVDGCEASLETLYNCGACGVTCTRANATASCSGTICHIESCNIGFANLDNDDANGCEACDPAYTNYPSCNQCVAGAFGQYPYCFLPASSYCLTSQCFAVPPTDQTSCFDNSGSMACTNFPCNSDGTPDFCGQDAQYPDNPRTFACYDVSGNLQDPCDANADEGEVVTDSLTGLMWQRTWVGGKTWQQAKDYCDNLVYAGHEDWRLPNPFELQSIINHGVPIPMIDTTFFPNTPTNRFWSSLECIQNNSNAWTADFVTGFIGRTSKSFYGYARCVRLRFSNTVEGGQRFHVMDMVADEQVVYDVVTGLLWQRSSVDNKYWKQALSYCESLDYGGYNDWRLPNIKELMSLLNYGRYNPSSDFPGYMYIYFWSSSSTYESSANAWRIYQDGDVSYAGKSSTPQQVRCVRSGL